MFLYLSNLDHMFRRKLHHPQGEILSLAQNYLLIVMSLHWLQDIRCIISPHLRQECQQLKIWHF